jgi:protocatechuate 3,4-dioxygenase alpha subunit
VGPFFAYGLTPAPTYPDVRGVFTPHVATADAGGEPIALTGRVLDGEGQPVPDAMIEIWQADGKGRFAGRDPSLSNADFRGFGRVETDAQGRWSFTTVKPGAVPGPAGASQAPHVAVSVFARGLLNRLVTRIYFADEPEANALDPVLALVPEDRRSTLVAQRVDKGVYALDLRLQGTGETVFFEV